MPDPEWKVIHVLPKRYFENRKFDFMDTARERYILEQSKARHRRRADAFIGGEFKGEVGRYENVRFIGG